MDFPLYFQNVSWPGGHLFSSNKNSEKAKHLRMYPILVVTYVKLDCVKALLSPDSNYRFKSYGHSAEWVTLLRSSRVILINKPGVAGAVL